MLKGAFFSFSSIKLEKFTNSLMQKPMGLHFTGHGVENNAATLGQDTFLMRDQGKLHPKSLESNFMTSYSKSWPLFTSHL